MTICWEVPTPLVNASSYVLGWHEYIKIESATTCLSYHEVSAILSHSGRHLVQTLRRRFCCMAMAVSLAGQCQDWRQDGTQMRVNRGPCMPTTH